MISTNFFQVRLQPALLLLAVLALCGCGGRMSITESSLQLSGMVNGPTLAPISGPNVMSVTVNGSTCSAGSYTNKPCVSVTVCKAGNPSICQSVSDILLDTGSFGFRVFKSVLIPNLVASLTPLKSGSGSLAQCTHFGDGSSTWGPVVIAGLQLGAEPVVQVPIQVMDASFSKSPDSCGTPNTGPSIQDAGYNGVLGVGVFGADCGDGCTVDANNQAYFSCTDSGCTGATAPLGQQVQNPVSLLPKDNNGLIVRLPSLGVGGSSATNGYVILGIGTQSNNTPGSVTAFPVDPDTGEFKTVYNGKTYSSILDTGSNALSFPSTQPGKLPTCSSDGSWYCPASAITLSASNSGASGSASVLTQFEVGNFLTLENSGNSVFMDLAGDGGNASGDALFDWGLPFHFGRDVYVGIEGKTSPLGAGPLLAY